MIQQHGRKILHTQNRNQHEKWVNCLLTSLWLLCFYPLTLLPSRVLLLKVIIYLKGKWRQLSLQEKYHPTASQCAMPPVSEGHKLLTWGQMMSSNLKIIWFCWLLSIWHQWRVAEMLLLISLPHVSWVFSQSSLALCSELSFPNASDWKCIPGDNCKSMLLHPVTSSVPTPCKSLRMTDAKWWHRSIAWFIMHVK